MSGRRGAVGPLARVAPGPAAVSAPDLGSGRPTSPRAYRWTPAAAPGRRSPSSTPTTTPSAEADLAVYRTACGLPSCTTRQRLLPQGQPERRPATPPQANAGWAVEIALDVQAVSAACPRCRILLVEADSEQPAGPRDRGEPGRGHGRQGRVQQLRRARVGQTMALGRRYFTHPGVAIVAASRRRRVPAGVVPRSLGQRHRVGGTTLSHSGASWSRRHGRGAGSGCSAYDHQAAPGSTTDTAGCATHRRDVSALADPSTGLAVYDTFGLGAGQRLDHRRRHEPAAPLVAGDDRRRRQRRPVGHGAVHLRPPQPGSSDVVGGSNGSCGDVYLCTRHQGYDGPTGLGSPRG